MDGDETGLDCGGSCARPCLSTPGQTYYLAPDGNDCDSCGTEQAPWKTLGYAVAHAPPGGALLKLAAGSFNEPNFVQVPPGIHIVGAGKDLTTISGAPNTHAAPEWNEAKILLRFVSASRVDGNHRIADLTLEGNEAIVGGLLSDNRDNLIIENVRVAHFNFAGIWLKSARHVDVYRCDFDDTGWANAGYSMGQINVNNLENVDFHQLRLSAPTKNKGTGIEARGPGGLPLRNMRVFDSVIELNQWTPWNTGSYSNFAVELWESVLDNVEFFDNTFHNNFSLVEKVTTTGSGTEIHHNRFDFEQPIFAIEGNGDNIDVHDNYMHNVDAVISNFGNEQATYGNWRIVNNVIDGAAVSYGGGLIRSRVVVRDVSILNNTIVFNPTNAPYGILYVQDPGASTNVDIQNNLFLGSTTSPAFSLNGGSISGSFRNNLSSSLDLSNAAGLTSANNTNVADVGIVASGNKPQPYFELEADSPAIDAGNDVGLPFSGAAPDIGAYERSPN